MKKQTAEAAVYQFPKGSLISLEDVLTGISKRLRGLEGLLEGMKHAAQSMVNDSVERYRVYTIFEGLHQAVQDIDARIPLQLAHPRRRDKAPEVLTSKSTA